MLSGMIGGAARSFWTNFCRSSGATISLGVVESCANPYYFRLWGMTGLARISAAADGPPRQGDGFVARFEQQILIHGKC